MGALLLVWNVIRQPLVLAVLLIAGAYLYGHHVGRTDCEAKVAGAVEAARLKDLATIATLQRELEQQDAENAANEQRLADYEAELARRGDGCVNTQEDADAINGG